ncbi:MAG: preprotein translocase subunit SecG [Rhizobacter sp.]|nr:preprotein translocase subunit SecG [Rhizobacter sp.]MBP6269777.1 preprotein translocase subunit SecG [Rhizobacter sp.]
MNLMLNLVVIVQILAALVMIGLVLVQHGKGADMGASFGSGASGSLFGATGSANFLSRSTAVCAAVFFACTLLLAFLANDRSRAAPTGSVLDRPAISAPDAGASGATQIPGGAGIAPAPATASAPAAAATSDAPASGAAAIPSK